MQNLTQTRRDLFRGTIGLAGLQAFAQSRGWSIHPDHPRLFFRREAWGEHNLTLAEVRRRGPAFADSLRVDHKLDPEAAPDWAMLYVITGEEQAARTAIAHMKRGYGRRDWTTTQGDQIEAIATAHDWLRGTYAGFDGEDRRAIEDILINGARDAMAHLGRGPSIYHTRMYAWANAVLFAGLALHGDREESDELVDFGIRFWKERLIPARRHLGGAWFNAMSYGQKYMCRSVFSMLTAWRAASGEDLWRVSREREGDWARNMMYYLMYTLRPDHRFATYGDLFNSMAESCQGTMRVVAQGTYATRDPHGQGFLDEIRRHCGGRSTRWESRWYQVFFDDSIPSRPRSDLPRARLFGRDSIGMALMRSGWGPDDAWALFKCGDYGDNHGHFDQGHFELFYKGRLAMDHYYWAKATEFHNTILVSDPADPKDRGNQREFTRQTHGTLEEYLADPVVNTGSILDYRDEDGIVYVAGDVTPAYDRSKVASFTRQVAFVDGRHFVVFDVVRPAEARFRCRWLIHYPSAPEIDGHAFRWRDGEGQLNGRTLLPRKAKLSAVPCDQLFHPPGAARHKKYWPAGRLTVEPEHGDSDTTLFLHVLSMADAGAPAPEIAFEESEAECTIRINGRELVFSKDGRGFHQGGKRG